MGEEEDNNMKLKENCMSLNEELIFVSKPSNLFGCGICDEEFCISDDLRQHIEIIRVKDRINSMKRMLYLKERELSEQRLVFTLTVRSAPHFRRQRYLSGVVMPVIWSHSFWKNLIF